ncbi:hypothetical protein BASA50_000322 [Batrachochytrium salamandrivorans]|uniref:Uncharacterized protein n=1 Tax=Batrachochytrium salamandrivorans TaxID=1357716 RepID=A0ABQ8EUF8_9FUNG|nr:hypothetical protein BASA50_000322 [Batrachochytrium salamandrivorans]
MPKLFQETPLSARQHALVSLSSQNCSTQYTPSSDPNPFNSKTSDPFNPQDPCPCGTQVEDGLRCLKYGRAHCVSSERHASLEVEKLPAGVVALSDQPIHLKELAQLYSDDQQAQAVVGPVLDEPPRRMSVAERVRSYEAKTMSSTTSVGHCAPAYIQTCRSVSTAAAMLAKMSPVSPVVVTPAASSSSTAPTTTNKLPSNVTLKASAGQLPTVETIDGLIMGLLTSNTLKTATNELPSNGDLKTSADKLPFNDILTALITEFISRGDSKRSADGVRLKDPLYELIMELVCINTPRPSMDGSPPMDPTHGLIMELISIEVKKQSKGKSAYKSTLHELLTELLFIKAIKPPAPTSPSGNIIKRTFLRILSFGTWSRLGRRNTKSVSSTGLDEPRDSINTVGSG